MKKLFLLISSIILSLNSNSCGLVFQHTEEANKNFLITQLVAESELDTRLFSTRNNRYYKDTCNKPSIFWTAVKMKIKTDVEIKKLSKHFCFIKPEKISKI